MAYPGRLRGVRQLLAAQHGVADRALRGLASRRSAALFAGEVRRRATEGLAIADALDAALAARPADKPDGLCIIDSETGLRKHQARHGRTGSRLRAAAGEAVPVDATKRRRERPAVRKV
jgi:hypothetical protein